MKRVRGWQHEIAPAEHKSAGFTLIELIVCVVIVVLMTAIALPLVQNVVANYQLSGAVASVTGAIQATRYQAVFNGYPFQVIFDSTAKTYQVKSDKNRAGVFANVCVDTAAAACPIPLAGSGTPVVINQDTTFTFSPGGSVTSPQAASGVTQIVVTYRSRQETINVSSYGNTKVTTP